MDAVSDVELARQQRRDLASRNGVDLLFVEVIASDADTHDGFAEWSEDRLRLDFSVEPATNARLVSTQLSGKGASGREPAAVETVDDVKL